MNKNTTTCAATDRTSWPELPVESGAAAFAPDVPVSFLFSRQHVTEVTAMDPTVQPGYIWRKVFLRGRQRSL